MYQDDNCFWGIHDNHWGAPGIWFFWITIFIITTLILYYLMRSTQGRRFSQNKESPLDILKRRYANGEITSEEFEERKRILDNN
jgi:putative membrane protein